MIPNFSNPPKTRPLITTMLALAAFCSPALGQIVPTRFAYAVADTNDRLVEINRFDGSEYRDIGPLGAPNIEAMTWNLRGTQLYATDAGQFGSINHVTGAFTPIGTGVGTGNGSLGSKSFVDVDGLTVDPNTGVFYGVERKQASSSVADLDLLIQINPTTGSFIPNAFGAGIDYLPISTHTLGTTPVLYDVDDLGISPIDGTIYGVANTSGGNDHLITINRQTGATTLIGQLRLADSTPVTDMEGYTYFNDGTLYGTTGNSSVVAAHRDTLWSINLASGVVTFVGKFTTNADYEAVGALHAGFNTISGTVYGDVNRDALLNGVDFRQATSVVKLYRDVNGDNLLDAGDILLHQATTDSVGFYSFEVASIGKFLTVVESSTLPASTTLTTAALQTSTFTAWGSSDPDNNFGFTGTSSIGDLVYQDVNNNGMFDTGDLRMGGVEVFLDLDGDGAYDPGEPLDSTDTNGNYLIDQLLPGTYTVVVADKTLPEGVVQTDDRDSTLDHKTSVVLGDAAAILDADFGYFDPGTISGTVSRDNDNNDTADTPLNLVVLSLFTDPNGDGNPSDGVQLGASVQTDSNGDYQFNNLPAGNYVVVETQPANYLTVLDGDTTADTAGSPSDASNASLVDNSLAASLSPGETDSGNDFLEELPGSISGISQEDTDLNGSGDTGINGVVLTLLTAAGQPVDDPNQAGFQSYTYTTSTNGSYTFTGLPPGNYQVVQTQPSGYTDVSDADGGSPSVIGNITAIELSPNENVVGQNFVDSRPASISGTVGRDSDNDNLSDAPVEEVSLALFTDPNGDGNPSDGTQVGASAITDEDGNYTFPNIPAGSYVVVETQPATYLNVSDGDSTPDDAGSPTDPSNASVVDNQLAVNLAPGEADSGNDFLEELTGNITGFSLEDTDLDTVGDTGITGVTITLRDSAGNDVDNPNLPGFQSYTATTGSNGSYAFNNLPPGGYQITQSQPVGYTNVSDVDGGLSNVIGNATPITLYAGNSITEQNFVDSRPATISGTVSRDNDNNGTADAPIAGVTLGLFTDPNGDGDPTDGAQRGASVQTGSTGIYTFSAVPAGSYVVVETQPANFITVSDDDSTADDAGSPADASNTSTVNNQLAVNVGLGESDTGNDFLEELPGNINGVSQEDTDLNGTGNTPITGVIITLLDGTGNDVDNPNQPGFQAYTATTGSNGEYTFTNLPPGDYQVVQTQPNGYTNVSPNTLTVALPTGGNVIDQNYVDSRPATISGTVSRDNDNNGTADAPIAGVTLGLFTDPNGDGDPTDGAQRGASVQTGSTGIYTFSAVPAGSYVVVETQPANFITVSDDDSTADDAGSPADASNASTVNNQLAVNVGLGESDTGNDFLEELPGNINGVSQEDTDLNGTGNTPITGVIITLLDGTGNDVDNPNQPGFQAYTATTGSNGEYTFTNLPPGDYQVVQTQPNGYTNVSPNTLTVALPTGGNVIDQNYVDSRPATISGTVSRDNDNNGTADAPIAGVTLGLFTDPNGDGDPTDGAQRGASVQTGSTGIYTFSAVPAGSYVVVETQPANFITVSDDDSTADDAGSPADASNTSTVNNQLAVNVGLGESDTGNDFLEELPGNINGVSQEDTDLNGTGNTPITGVIITLLDGTGNDVDNPNQPGFQAYTATTGSNGEYTFTNLPPGDYQVVQTQPNGYTNVSPNTLTVALPTGGNVIDQNYVDSRPATISGTVSRDNDNNGTADAPIAGVTLGLFTDPNGDGDPTDGAQRGASVQTGSTGIYTFSAVPAGSYVVVETQPANHNTVNDGDVTSPADDIPNASLVDNAIPVTLLPGEVDDGNNFLEAFGKPTTWANWQAQYPLGGQNGPNQDPDGDGVTNLEEFAFCLNPQSGLGGCVIELLANGDGTMDVSYRTVTGITGLSYTLEFITDLNDSGPNGAGWTPFTEITPSQMLNGDLTIQLYDNVETENGLETGTGYVRVKVAADLNNDGDTTDLGETARTEVLGWRDHLLRAACETFSQPFLTCPTLQAAVTTQSAQGMDISGSLGTQTLAGLFDSTRRYYAEVVSGTYEGHRFELDTALSTGTELFYQTTGTLHHTLTPIPSLVGSKIAVRSYPQLAEQFPTADFTAGTSVSTSDYVLVHEDGTWNTYYLLATATPKWVKAGAGTTDQGDHDLQPCSGIFVHRRQTSVMQTYLGQVRETKFACPLPVGVRFVANPYPVAASVNDRGLINMTTATAIPFTGTNAVSRADQVLLWDGDTTENATSYSTNYYLKTSTRNYYTSVGNSELPDISATLIFQSLRSQGISTMVAHPDYVMPLPWVP